MSENNIKLSKKIISNRLSNKIYSKNFNDIARSSSPINEEKVKDLYDTLFYSIPKKGKNSHESIIKESKDYIYPEINKKLDDQLEKLVREIEEKQKELQDLKTGPPTNTEYPNGSFLAAGTGVKQYQGMPTIYVMQDGRKRAFANTGFYKLARKALKVPGEIYSELFFISVDELNQIPDGTKIDYQSKFSSKNIEADYGIIYQRYPFTTLELHCEGREADDSMDLIAGNFWLDDDPDDACKVTYVKNEFQGDSEKYSIETETIGVGETKSIEFARNGTGLRAIPREIDYDLYYDYNIDIQQTGTRLWGKGKEHEGILLAEGRILLDGNPFNTKTNQTDLIRDLSFDEMYGDVRKIYSHGCRQLNGDFEDCFGDLNQNNDLAEKFESPDFRYYQKYVSFSSAEILQDLGTDVSTSFFGAYFAKVDHIKALGNGKSFPVYGQPILKLQGRYVIYLKFTEVNKGTYAGEWKEDTEDLRFHYFYVLDENSNKKLIKIKDKNLPDLLFNKQNETYMLQTAYRLGQDAAAAASSFFGGGSSLGGFLGAIPGYGTANLYSYSLVGPRDSGQFNWEAVKKNKVAYIGLAHDPFNPNLKIRLASHKDNENYFNPFEEGSNYGISGEVRTILEDKNENYSNTSETDFCPFTKAQLEEFSLKSIPAGNNTNLPLGCTFENCLDC